MPSLQNGSRRNFPLSSSLLSVPSLFSPFRWVRSSNNFSSPSIEILRSHIESNGKKSLQKIGTFIQKSGFDLVLNEPKFIGDLLEEAKRLDLSVYNELKKNIKHSLFNQGDYSAFIEKFNTYLDDYSGNICIKEIYKALIQTCKKSLDSRDKMFDKVNDMI